MDNNYLQLSTTVYAETINNVLKIVINREKMGNAVDDTVASGIDKGIEYALENNDIRVILLTGSGGKFFCTGMDLNYFSEHGEAGLCLPGKGFCGVTEREIKKPIICAVNGYALGGGCELALSCDLIIAASHAKFGLPEVKRGIFAGAGGPMLIGKSIPRVLANEMLFTGDFVTADRACEMHLINRVVPSEELMNEAMKLAESIAVNAPLALQATKELATKTSLMTKEQSFEFSRKLSKVIFESEDAKEGVRAFAEKRPPVWQNK